MSRAFLCAHHLIISELAPGKASPERLLKVDINDVLGRDAVGVHTELLTSRIVGQSVIVTGANVDCFLALPIAFFE